MQYAPRILILSLLLVAGGAGASSPSDGTAPRGEFDIALQRVESVLADPDAAREDFHAVALLLERPWSEREAPRDLVRHLADQLHTLALYHASVDTRPARIAAARETLLRVAEKARRPTARQQADLAALAPTYDACANALEFIHPATGSTAEAAAGGDASCGDSTEAPDVWYRYTAPSEEILFLTAEGTDYDPVLSLHSACPDAASLHEWSCNDDHGSEAAVVARPLDPGETVFIRVSGSRGASGEYTLSRLDPGGALFGQVREEATGAPVDDAWVSLFLSSFGFYQGAALTDAEGHYFFDSLSPADYYLIANHRDLVNEAWNNRECHYCEPHKDGDPVAVDGDLVDGIDFDLTAGSSFQGKVTFADGEPEYVEIIAYDATGWWLASTYTYGDFLISGLPPGPVTVLADASWHLPTVWPDQHCLAGCDLATGTPVQLSPGTVTPGIDFHLPALGSIRGRVVDIHGEAIDQAIVSALRPNLTQIDSNQARGGDYELTRLYPGEYLVTAGIEGYRSEVYDGVACENGCPWQEALRIPVALNTITTGVDFVLDRLGRIEGSAYDRRSGEEILAEITAYDLEGRRIDSGSTWPPPYVIEDLPPGGYYLKAVPMNFYYNPTGFESRIHPGIWCDGENCDVTRGEPVFVGINSAIPQVDFHLTRCLGDWNVSLTDLAVTNPSAYEACREVHAGDGVTVSSDLTLRAQYRVRLSNGFSVEAGGSLQVVLDPNAGAD